MADAMNMERSASSGKMTDAVNADCSAASDGMTGIVIMQPGATLCKKPDNTADDPLGFICEATVKSQAWSSVVDGVQRTHYFVYADNGRDYEVRWAYDIRLNAGDVVQLIHDNEGGYYIEPIYT